MCTHIPIWTFLHVQHAACTLFYVYVCVFHWHNTLYVRLDCQTEFKMGDTRHCLDDIGAHELKFISFYVTKKTTVMTTTKRMVNPFMSLYILPYNMPDASSSIFLYFSSLSVGSLSFSFSLLLLFLSIFLSLFLILFLSLFPSFPVFYDICPDASFSNEHKYTHKLKNRSSPCSVVFKLQKSNC